jgi:hypothetical protein
VTDPEFWLRPPESSEINTKTTKRLPTRRPIISFINTPLSLLVARQSYWAESRSCDDAGLYRFSINSLFHVKKGDHWFLNYWAASNSRTTFRASLSSLSPINFFVKLTYKITGNRRFYVPVWSHTVKGVSPRYLRMVTSGTKIPRWRLFALAGIPCACAPLFAEHSH